MGRIADIFRIEMQEALYKSYLEILKSGECSTQHEAIERARKSPAPHFFTSAKNCTYILRLIENGRDTGLRNPDKVRKFEELRRRVDAMREGGEFPGLLPASRKVVRQPAPEYYICYSTAKQMILQERRARQQRMIRWINH